MAVAAVIAPGMTQADTIIDTTGSFTGSSYNFPFGIPNAQTYGQVVTAPTNGDTVLQSFTFYMAEPSTVSFRGEVYAWDGHEAVGPNLWESGLTSTNNNAFNPVTFTTGGVALTGNLQYVLFATTSKDNGIVGNFGQGTWAATPDVYSGGNFVYLDNGADTSKWFSTPWLNFGGDDVAFQADFSTAVSPANTSAPLPSPAWAGAGLLLLAGVTMKIRNTRRAV